MSILAWIALGLIAGFVASRIVGGTGNGILTDLGLGVVGAMLGGGVFHLLGQRGITGFNLWSVFVATVGAVLLLAAYHLISGRRRHA